MVLVTLRRKPETYGQLQLFEQIDRPPGSRCDVNRLSGWTEPLFNEETLQTTLFSICSLWAFLSFFLLGVVGAGVVRDGSARTSGGRLEGSERRKQEVGSGRSP